MVPLPWAASGHDVTRIRAAGRRRRDPAAQLVRAALHRGPRRHRRTVGLHTGTSAACLLSRAVAEPRPRLHQVDYYRHLVAALGFASGPREPRLTAPAAAIDRRGSCSPGHGWTGDRRLIGVAPGAAYGGAKRWPPERFAACHRRAHRGHGLACVLVGGAADATTAMAIEAELGKITDGRRPGAVINLVGRTDLPQLCGVARAWRRVCVERLGRDACGRGAGRSGGRAVRPDRRARARLRSAARAARC